VNCPMGTVPFHELTVTDLQCFAEYVELQIAPLSGRGCTSSRFATATLLETQTERERKRRDYRWNSSARSRAWLY
jgi:hypothetical protein